MRHKYETHPNCYDDIMELKRPVSMSHPPMDRSKRAAQFSPFSALSGYEDAVKETERRTENRIELDEDAKRLLDQKLQMILAMPPNECNVTVTHFSLDKKKQGGQYIDTLGQLMKVDSYAKCLVLQNGQRIRIEDIIGLTVT